MPRSRKGKKASKPPRAIPEADKPQVLEDLGYMIDQLRHAYKDAFQNNGNQAAHNSAVKSWGMQARALTEFFMGNKRYSVEIRDLVDSEYQILISKDDPLYGAISREMSHLQVRPSKDEDKIRPNSDDMKRLEDEIARFQKHLKPEYRSMFVLRTTPLIVASPTKAAATSAIPSTSILSTLRGWFRQR